MDPHDEMLRGQAQVWKLMFAFADSMALKWAVELRIPDIIHSQGGGPVTLAQIASRITSPTPETAYLARIMTLLVRKNVFSPPLASSPRTATGERRSTASPRRQDGSCRGSGHLSLARMVLLVGHHPTLVSPWHYVSDCIKDGGSIAFEMAPGREFWDLESKNPEFSHVFHDATACTTKCIMQAIVDACKDGFERVGSLVDVGGGTGGAIAEIVRLYPHIKGINFDRPRVVASAPAHGGVSHVGGDMLEAIPTADAVFMKGILHDWNDEDCVRILKNCRRARPEKNGVVIVADIVLRPDGDGLFDEARIGSDLMMMAQTGGKERSEPEWKKILEEGGFPRYNIIQAPSLSIIEAFPTVIAVCPELALVLFTC